MSNLTRRRISPTDILKFILLDQCERYLAYRLRENREGPGFITEYDVAAQAIPPLLTYMGDAFERQVEEALDISPMINFAQKHKQPGRPPNNDEVIKKIQLLGPSQTLILLQARLAVPIQGWEVRGDLDLLLLERDEQSALRLLVVDLKSSIKPKVEHRLQVVFYQLLLEALLAQNGVPFTTFTTGILYQGPRHNEAIGSLSGEEVAILEKDRQAARDFLGIQFAYLELLEDISPYRSELQNFVFNQKALARHIANRQAHETSYHLNHKCDGCHYNEYCLKRSAENDDLSLLPHLTHNDKKALNRHGIYAVHELANLKHLAGPELVSVPEQESIIEQLNRTWSLGPRLDELIHRARRYRNWKSDDIETLFYIPYKGYGSLPYSDADHNPNLVRIYIDAQHDYLQDRIYLLGALVVANDKGDALRRRSIVHLTDTASDSAWKEANLFVNWIDEVIQAVFELAVPDESGRKRAPIHLIFYDRSGQRVLLDGLARHQQAVFGATPLYDLMTQLAAFDSPFVSFLSDEIREQKNYPMLCQSLYQVAAYLGFDWGDYRHKIFVTRLFDFWGRLDKKQMAHQESPWYTNRARFNSQVPLEYAYAAWEKNNSSQKIPAPENDPLAPYRRATVEHLKGFQARRLEAIECITKDFEGNRQTEKSLFDLSRLANFSDKARTLAHALEEFVTIERHVWLASWKATRNLAPERRVLMGETLLLRYYDEDQTEDVARQMQKARKRYEKQGTDPKFKDRHIRFRIETAGLEIGIEEVLAQSQLRVGEYVVLSPRYSVDSRLPVDEQLPFTPTPKQLLYKPRAVIKQIEIERASNGQALAAMLDLQMRGGFSNRHMLPFVFSSYEQPLYDGQLNCIDLSLDNWYGYYISKVTQRLRKEEEAGHDTVNTLYHRLKKPGEAFVSWPQKASQGQQRFMQGLQAFHAIGAIHAFDAPQQDYIKGYGDVPTLLVQGPPGTGKSYSTAFALLARMQGAIAANIPFRIIVSCKTHAATDVLIKSIRDAQRTLEQLREMDSSLFDQFFDSRLLRVPLYRIDAKNGAPDGVQPLSKNNKPTRNADILSGDIWNITAATPGGVYNMIKRKSSKLFGFDFCHCLVLDEASQMNLPEAAMAALPLHSQGHLIVVGDHRQMPPIVHHNWENERRRTFQEYETYQSLFNTLRQVAPALPMIQLARSFRLHATMAEFLRQEIYVRDGINYHSLRGDLLESRDYDDPFVAAVLAPSYPMIVVWHEEDESQTRNLFEQKLMAPLIEALLLAGFDPLEGLGIVVPHRAQRADIQRQFPDLVERDADGTIINSAVDTVERFQGDEREVIVVSATESDRNYLLSASNFLFDPRRLTVALSRAKHKMILIASHSIFSLFSPDEETFANLQLWKNLLRGTCTELLWEGEKEDVAIRVWGAPVSFTFHANSSKTLLSKDGLSEPYGLYGTNKHKKNTTMNILNRGQITPHRLHALLKLVPRLRHPRQENLLDLLQPPNLVHKQKAAEAVYSIAKQLNLIAEQSDKKVVLHHSIDSADNIESLEAFRAIMQKRLIGIIDEEEGNYLLNLVAAWHAVQDERLFRYKKKDEIAQQFNDDMYRRSGTESIEQGRAFNTTKLNGWLTWASFLGWGWRMTVGKDMLMPDAHIRLQSVLPELLAPEEGSMPFAIFGQRLAEICPELDGGILFEKCWQASRGTEKRGNRLSLMLSTGLRILHEMDHIELTRQGDATDIWRLYPAQGHPLNEITHIQLKGTSHD